MYNGSYIVSVHYIVKNNFYIDKELESGILLQGWEVKSLRCCLVNIKNSYVSFKDHEIFVYNINFFPLQTSFVSCRVSCHKLLLHRYEIDYLFGCVSRKNCVILVLSMYWKNSLAKVSIGVGKRKKKYDKRFCEKDRSWKMDKLRIMRNGCI
ncbi:MAG: SsrA-binding protein [Candidatus Westeberhardia cardiocondylae]|nr:SsrA-binding protein [Candidatus Westeberhardia cardiocondylae]